MIPILFDPLSTDFTTNGLGRLKDAISCKVIEALNGEYELELTYPNTGRLFDSIKHSSIIAAKPFQKDTIQGFRAYKIGKEMKGLVTIYARHVSYQLNYIPCSTFSGQQCNDVLQNMKNAAVEPCPFNFSTDITETKTQVSENLYNYEKSEIGTISLKIGSGGLLEYDEYATSIWLKCEKSKRYEIKKMLSNCFAVGCMSTFPNPDSYVDNPISDASKRELNYTTTSNAEYLVIYVHNSAPDIDGTNTYDAVMNSMIIRSLGTYTWMLYEPRCIRACLLGDTKDTIQAVYGGEFEWDNYTVKFNLNRGSDKGVKIRYGKNLKSLKQEENIENTITGIYPIWYSEKTLVELPANKRVVYADNSIVNNYPYHITVIQDFTSEFDTKPSVEELEEKAKVYVKENEIGIPKVSLEVDFVNLADTMEYSGVSELQTVNLGDTVSVEFPDLGVTAKQKVTKTEYDVLAERYTKITIGDIEETIDKTLESQMNELSEKVSTEENQNTIDRATGILNAGAQKGHVIISRNENGFANEIYFLDNANTALAKQVLRINEAGIGFSSTGIHGTYAQAWTLDGHLTLGGINNKHGTLQILDAEGHVIGIWNNEKLEVVNGIIRSGQFISKNGEFYVIENDEEVEVGWTGWNVERGRMMSNEMGWLTNSNVNPSSATSASAAINGGELSSSSTSVNYAYSLSQYGEGNIDLYNRPQYRNQDGSISTVRSISFGSDQGEILIPTIGFGSNGEAVSWSDEEAINHYHETGEYLGIFDTVAEADAYAQRLHLQQQAYYALDLSSTNSEENNSEPVSQNDGFSGTASFKAIWLDDPWYERESSNYSYDPSGHSQHHLWDLTETLHWLDGRITWLEDHMDDDDDDDNPTQGGQNVGEGGGDNGDPFPDPGEDAGGDVNNNG